MDIIEAINESKSKKGKSNTTAKKSRVKIYPSIVKALKRGYPGQMFSTKSADRVYVITAGGWGKDKDQRVAGRTAKGFTPGSATPGASWKDIKGYAARTMVKHGKQSDKNLKSKKHYKSGYRGK
jgi:hypothetical protein|tara:strand:- start:66 stop:437 length:372 start_codon:yes stop_codon:yes gene_type:complete